MLILVKNNSSIFVLTTCAILTVHNAVVNNTIIIIMLSVSKLFNQVLTLNDFAYSDCQQNDH